MNNTLKYLVKKFELDLSNLSKKSDIEITNVNRTIMAETLGELGFKEGAEIEFSFSRDISIMNNTVSEIEHFTGLDLQKCLVGQ